jgi:hypothetical protein
MTKKFIWRLISNGNTMFLNDAPDQNLDERQGFENHENILPELQ